jgi:hypothetical protein
MLFIKQKSREINPIHKYDNYAYNKCTWIFLYDMIYPMNNNNKFCIHFSYNNVNYFDLWIWSQYVVDIDRYLNIILTKFLNLRSKEKIKSKFLWSYSKKVELNEKNSRYFFSWSAIKYCIENKINVLLFPIFKQNNSQEKFKGEAFFVTQFWMNYSLEKI